MEARKLKKIHENHEFRLHCEYKLNGNNNSHTEEYWVRLGNVDGNWEMRIQRRPADGHRLHFGQAINPEILPKDTSFDLTPAPKAAVGLKSWAAQEGWDVETDKNTGRMMLLPKVVSLSLRLPRELHDELRTRVFERNAESINQEIVSILCGMKVPLRRL